MSKFILLHSFELPEMNYSSFLPLNKMSLHIKLLYVFIVQTHSLLQKICDLLNITKYYAHHGNKWSPMKDDISIYCIPHPHKLKVVQDQYQLIL